MLQNRPDDCELVRRFESPVRRPLRTERRKCASWCCRRRRRSARRCAARCRSVARRSCMCWRRAWKWKKVGPTPSCRTSTTTAWPRRATGAPLARGGSRLLLRTRIRGRRRATTPRLWNSPAATAQRRRRARAHTFRGVLSGDVLRALPAPFDDRVTAELLDVDLALQIRAAGYRAVVEPSSFTYRAAAVLPTATPFAEARGAERLFWRNAPAVGWARSLALHLARRTWWRTQAPLIWRGDLKRAGPARRMLGNLRLPPTSPGARGARHAGPRVHDDFDRRSHPRRRRPPALADDRENRPRADAKN